MSELFGGGGGAEPSAATEKSLVSSEIILHFVLSGDESDLFSSSLRSYVLEGDIVVKNTGLSILSNLIGQCLAPAGTNIREDLVSVCSFPSSQMVICPPRSYGSSWLEPTKAITSSKL